MEKIYRQVLLRDQDVLVEDITKSGCVSILAQKAFEKKLISHELNAIVKGDAPMDRKVSQFVVAIQSGCNSYESSETFKIFVEILKDIPALQKLGKYLQKSLNSAMKEFEQSSDGGSSDQPKPKKDVTQKLYFKEIETDSAISSMVGSVSQQDTQADQLSVDSELSELLSNSTLQENPSQESFLQPEVDSALQCDGAGVAEVKRKDQNTLSSNSSYTNQYESNIPLPIAQEAIHHQSSLVVSRCANQQRCGNCVQKELALCRGKSQILLLQEQLMAVKSENQRLRGTIENIELGYKLQIEQMRNDMEREMWSKERELLIREKEFAEEKLEYERQKHS